MESLFSVYTTELALPGMHVVYTVPICAIPPAWPGKIWPVRNVKVREKKGSECAEGIELLREVIARRVPELNLDRLLDDQVDSVIRSSGELFRDLFLLVSDLVAKQGGFPVDDKKVESVEYKERSHVNVGRVARARGDSGTADALNREHEQTTRHIEEQAEA